MKAVEKILWYIEVELRSELDLARIAGHFGLSPFALARLFALSTGWPVMRYVRARRLSQAALALCRHESQVLDVALDAGYGSHEAFTRAFSDQFGITPRQCRERGHQGLQLVEPLRMKELTFTALSEPRFESRAAFVIAGCGARFTFDKNEGIVGLWQTFIPYAGQIPGQVDGFSYGLCCNPGEDGSFEYIAGVEVSRVDELPTDFRHFKVPGGDYAVFRHCGHISTLHQTFFTIFNQWFPKSGYHLAQAPEFEQYSADFDPTEEKGYVDIWMPITGC